MIIKRFVIESLKTEREIIITAQSRRKTTTNPTRRWKHYKLDLLSLSFSVGFINFSSSSSNREKLSDDFKRHTFSFRDLKEHKDP